MRTTLLPLLLVSGTAGPLLAQDGPPKSLVTFTGAIEPAGPSICLQGSHVLECNGALLESAGEALVYIPLGILALFWFLPRWREGETNHDIKA